MRLAALLLVVLVGTAGCLEILGLGVSLISTGVGIYQRKSAREAQDEQTGEIKALREEIARLRAKWADTDPARAPSPVSP